jgi:glycine/D-amino acid oxidase-like deaminating enzyme
MDVIVIGAGVVGSSLAFRLAQRGARVTLLERGAPGVGTSGSSFAWTNANQKEPRDYYELNLAGMRAHRALREEVGGAPWLFEGGNLELATPAAADELETRLARLRSWGYRAEWLDRASIAELEPGLRPEAEVEGAAWFPDEDAIAAPLLAASLTQQAVVYGATLRTRAEVVGVTRTGERVSGVTLRDGAQLAAGMVVNCAGPWANAIAQLAGRRLPLTPTPGLIVRVSGGAGLVGRVVHAPRLHMRPDVDGLLLVHSADSDEALANGGAPRPWLDELLVHAQAYLPALKEPRIARWGVGVRPIPADERTSAGAVPSLPGYAEIVTHSGVTLGPLLGSLVANELLTGEVDPLLTPFRPERFGETP